MSEVLAPDDLQSAEDGGLTTDTLTRGTRLGRYELLLPIAMGGMAKVWAARQRGQRGFSKLVAIKTILPNLSEDPAFESMFLDEARIASNVHHPNVCDIYELGEEGKVLYLAMEWVNGDSLVRVLRASGATSERIDPRIAARIIADACAGVHAAHELADDIGRPLGVVHRDMSPHNILLSADGNVKVTDFGVAKAIGQLHEQTSTGTLKGKVNYMAPEQITGTHIDRRSDVFALGCVLYEATTGQLPFRDRNELDHQVMQRVMAGRCTPPAQLAPGYPRELDAIVMRAIANQPIQRFATAERLRMALEEWLQMSGPIVTQSHVAATVRARVGPAIDARRERIRVAMSTTGPNEDTGVTPNPSASGVVPAGTGGTAPGQTSGTGSKRLRRPALTMSPLSQPLFAPPPAALAPESPAAPAGAQAEELASTLLFPMESVARAVQASGGAGGAPAPTSAVPAAAAPAPSPSYFLAAGAGVAVAFAIGAAAFLLWHLTRPPEASVPTGSANPAVSVIVVPAPPPAITGAFPPAHAAVDTASSAPPGAFAPAPSASVAQVEPSPAPAVTASTPAPSPMAASAGDSPAVATGDTAKTSVAPAPAAPATGDQPAPPEPVVLDVPEGATVLVGGAALEGGGHVVGRPRPGKTVTAVVRAPGYDDAIVTIDATTTSPVEVTLHKHRHRAAPAIPANPY